MLKMPDQRLPEAGGVAERVDDAGSSDVNAMLLIDGGRGRGHLRLDEMSDAIDHLVNVLDMPGVLIVDLNVELAFKAKEDVESVE
jgi:hypothetical protein